MLLRRCFLFLSRVILMNINIRSTLLPVPSATRTRSVQQGCVGLLILANVDVVPIVDLSQDEVVAAAHTPRRDWDSVVRRQRRGAPAPVPLGPSRRSRDSSSRSFCTWRWTPSSRVFRRQKFGRYSHPASSHRVWSKSVPSTRSSRPILCPLRMSHCSVRMARDLHKLTRLNWTFMPDSSWQRKELPGPPSFAFWWASFRGPPHNSSCWTWHLLRSWTTSEKWSGASRS